MPVLDLAGPFAQGVSTPHADGDFWMLAKMNQLRRVLRRATAPTLQRVVTLVVCDPCPCCHAAPSSRGEFLEGGTVIQKGDALRRRLAPSMAATSLQSAAALAAFGGQTVLLDGLVVARRRAGRLSSGGHLRRLTSCLTVPGRSPCPGGCAPSGRVPASLRLCSRWLLRDRRWWPVGAGASLSQGDVGSRHHVEGEHI